MQGDANFPEFTEGLPVTWQLVLNGVFLIIIAASSAYAYIRVRKQPKASDAQAQTSTMQVIGGTLANRDAVERLAHAIEELTAELKTHREDANDRDRDVLRDELSRLRSIEGRTPPRARK
jgi:biopolymer transport protein ExbB/TolQ